MQGKTIWIINQYASTPETGMGGRHFHMARELVKQGHKVYLIAASYTHLLHKLPKGEQSYEVQSIEGFNFVWVRVPHYSDAHSNKRILNWFLFAWKLRRLAKVIADKPDAILCSSPSLVSFLGAKQLAKRFNARLVFEVRDIWPLTFIELGSFSFKHPFIRLLQWIEDKAYRDSDRVVSNLKNSVDHMVSRGMDRKKFTWIPNGFSLTETSHAQNLPDTIVAKLPKGKFIIGYTGTIGTANVLEFLIDAAQMLKDQPEIAFVIVGGGREKSKLEDLSKSNGLDNLCFVGSIPKVQIQSMLKQFDVCFIGWRNETLYRFGIAANKLFDYFYAAKPVLHSYSGKCDPVINAEAGLQVPAEDSESIAKAIMELYHMPKKERERMGANGRCYVLENHEYGTLAEKLADVLVGE